jgi:hypothetical protein
VLWLCGTDLCTYVHQVSVVPTAVACRITGSGNRHGRKRSVEVMNGHTAADGSQAQRLDGGNGEVRLHSDAWEVPSGIVLLLQLHSCLMHGFVVLGGKRHQRYLRQMYTRVAVLYKPALQDVVSWCGGRATTLHVTKSAWVAFREPLWCFAACRSVVAGQRQL